MGNNWDPISDEFFKTGSVGAIGISESDPNVVYVGMASLRFAETFRTVTAFTNQPTREKHGSKSDLPTPARYLACAFILEIPTSFMWGPSVTCLGLTKSAACFAQPTAARIGRRFSIAVRRRAQRI